VFGPGAGTIVVGVIQGNSGQFDSDVVVNGINVIVNGGSGYFGPTYVYGGGTLSNGVDNALPSNTTLTLGESTSNTIGTYNLNGFNQTVAAILTAGNGVPQTITTSAAVPR